MEKEIGNTENEEQDGIFGSNTWISNKMPEEKPAGTISMGDQACGSVGLLQSKRAALQTRPIDQMDGGR